MSKTFVQIANVVGSPFIIYLGPPIDPVANIHLPVFGGIRAIPANHHRSKFKAFEIRVMHKTSVPAKMIIRASTLNTQMFRETFREV